MPSNTCSIPWQPCLIETVFNIEKLTDIRSLQPLLQRG
jgi:hypothetical protein